MGRHSNLIFLSADFKEFEPKNLYKALNLVKPDIVVV